MQIMNVSICMHALYACKEHGRLFGWNQTVRKLKEQVFRVKKLMGLLPPDSKYLEVEGGYTHCIYKVILYNTLYTQTCA